MSERKPPTVGESYRIVWPFGGQILWVHVSEVFEDWVVGSQFPNNEDYRLWRPMWDLLWDKGLIDRIPNLSGPR